MGLIGTKYVSPFTPLHCYAQYRFKHFFDRQYEIALRTHHFCALAFQTTSDGVDTFAVDLSFNSEKTRRLSMWEGYSTMRKKI